MSKLRRDSFLKIDIFVNLLKLSIDKSVDTYLTWKWKRVRGNGSVKKRRNGIFLNIRKRVRVGSKDDPNVDLAAPVFCCIGRTASRCGSCRTRFLLWLALCSEVEQISLVGTSRSALLELQARVVVHSSRSSRVSTAGGSWEASFSLTQFAKLFGGGINHLEHRCGEANITKAWSHGSSKVSSLFGNAPQWSSYGFCSTSISRVRVSSNPTGRKYFTIVSEHLKRIWILVFNPFVNQVHKHIRGDGHISLTHYLFNPSQFSYLPRFGYMFN
ncbi:hypothetical protein YC2023_063380 [Brassica napus]